MEVTASWEDDQGIPHLELADGEARYTAVADPDDLSLLWMNDDGGEAIERGDQRRDAAQAAWAAEAADSRMRLASVGAEGEGSLAIAEIHPLAHRNARVRRWLGIANASATDVAFSSHQSNTVVYLCRSGDPFAAPPYAVDEKSRRARSFGEARDVLVVVGGGYQFMARYLRELRDPDLVIFVGDERDLRELGVEILDAGWRPGDPARSLDDLLYPSPGGILATAAPAPAEEPPAPPPSPADDGVTPSPGPAPNGSAPQFAPASPAIAERRRPPASPPQAIKRHAEYAAELGASTPTDFGPARPIRDFSDDDIAGRAAAFLGGDVPDAVEPVGEPQVGPLRVGGFARVASTGDRGVVMSLDAEGAAVRFEGAGTQRVPIEDLEPAAGP